jgi:hypothetical protein
MRAADDLRAKGIAAASLFKPSLGGWIVQILPGGIRHAREHRDTQADRGKPA